jgi:hypothetical protein
MDPGGGWCPAGLVIDTVNKFIQHNNHFVLLCFQNFDNLA